MSSKWNTSSNTLMTSRMRKSGSFWNLESSRWRRSSRRNKIIVNLNNAFVCQKIIIK